MFKYFKKSTHPIWGCMRPCDVCCGSGGTNGGGRWRRAGQCEAGRPWGDGSGGRQQGWAHEAARLVASSPVQASPSPGGSPGTGDTSQVETTTIHSRCTESKGQGIQSFHHLCSVMLSSLFVRLVPETPGQWRSCACWTHGLVYTEDWEKHMTLSFRATARPSGRQGKYMVWRTLHCVNLIFRMVIQHYLLFFLHEPLLYCGGH